jgi:hypothetical protein
VKPHKVVVWVAVAAEAALIRAVHLVTEAVAARLTATVLKVDQAAGEVAQVKAKAVPDKTTRFL